MSDKVYVDNASTSFPKAPGVSDAIKDFLDNTGCNVNRGGYAVSYDIGMEVLETRQLLADLFGVDSPQEVIFTPSVTYSLNMLLQGFLREGDHVITTSMEHNAVMRPLHALAQRGVTYDVVACGADGALRERDIVPLIQSNTKAVVMLHASNVCGTVLSLDEVATICREHGLRLIVDAAQTAGVLDINAGSVDALAFTGHKGLLGPQGIGGFIIKKDFANEIAPLITGGTGSRSHEIEHPDFLPDKFEPGTLNIPAILGLRAAVEYLTTKGLAAIRAHELDLTDAFIAGVRDLDESGEVVRLIGCEGAPVRRDTQRRPDALAQPDRIAVVSLDFPRHDNAAIAAALDSEYGIMTRCGLHCAPTAHHTLGTYPNGTVRFSFGHVNTADEIAYIVQSLRHILKGEVRYGF